METVVANVAGKARRATLHGREYLVAPLTLIVPGVLSGSKGPLLYPAEEVGKDPTRWNGVPLVVYHPVTNGDHVSARDPDVIDRQCVGHVYRARFDGKLTAEGWFDREVTGRVDNRVLSSLLMAEQIELSTGLFLDQETAPEGAVHNGVAYGHVARNYVPDHLAVLPDQRGACSIKDGCGVLVNQKLSHDDLRMKLMEQLEKRFGAGGMAEYGHQCQIVDVFDRTVIYRHGERLWEIGYTTDLRTGSVELKAEAPREVTRVTSYKPVANARLVANPRGQWEPPDAGDAPAEVKKILRRVYSRWRDEHPAEDARTKAKGARIAWGAVKRAGWKKGADGKWHKRGAVMNREETIAWLVTNCDCWKREGDRDVLAKLPDDNLARLKAAAETPAVTANAATPPAPVAARPATAQEWMAAAPPEVRSAVANAMAVEQREKQAAVDRLLANVAADQRPAREQRLRAKPLDELRDMLDLLPPAQDAPAPLWLGASAPAVANRQEPELDVLTVPTWNYGEPKRA